MAARTTTPEYDFDAWTEEDEEKAIAALVPDVKHIIVERRFIGRFTDGTTVELPLTITLQDVDALEQDATGPVDQVKHLLARVGGEAAAKQFARHDITETAILARRYFATLSRIQRASLPE